MSRVGRACLLALGVFGSSVQTLVTPFVVEAEPMLAQRSEDRAAAQEPALRAADEEQKPRGGALSPGGGDAIHRSAKHSEFSKLSLSIVRRVAFRPMRTGLATFQYLVPPRCWLLLSGPLLMWLLLAGSGCATSPSNAAHRPPVETKEAQKTHQAAETNAVQRAAALVEKMTLKEKIMYLGGDRDFFVRPLERLGIPEIKLADGPVGCRNWGPSTAYPASIGLAAAFDEELIHDVGAAIGRDCKTRGVHVLLAPGVNIQRSPLTGRNFEYFGEDPLVASRSAVGFIRGVQEQGVLATVKHYVLNNQEYDRHHVSGIVSERALREIYLRPFQAAVQEAQVQAVMTSYNLVNGVYASHHSWLLRDVLRKEWGFDGIVMSDWVATHDAFGAVKGGLDLEMPRAEHMNPDKLKPLLEVGLIREEEIDQKVQHLLATFIRAGFFDREQKTERPLDDPKSAQVAHDAARRSVVLLKNESGREGGAPLLPLAAAGLKRIAVIGPNATPAVHGGSGSAYTTPFRRVSLLEGLRKARRDVEFVTHPGIRQRSGFGKLGQPVFSGSVKQEFFEGTELEGPPIVVREVDRVALLAGGKAPVTGVSPENFSVRWTGTIEVDVSGTYEFMANADDGVRVFVDGKKVLDDFTDHAPRMSRVTIDLQKGEHLVVVEYFQGILGSICQFGWGHPTKAGDLYGAEELQATLEGVDLVVLALGYGQSEETNSLGSSFEPFWPPGWARQAGIVEAEDDDRDFALPAPQRATLDIVTAAGRPSVLVGFSGSPVDLTPWQDSLAAIVWAFYPGQSGGTALAEILVGEVNPSAHLPFTFARSFADSPSAASYLHRSPIEQEGPRMAELSVCETLTIPDTLSFPEKSERQLYESPYCEDVFVGYRGFDHAETEPLYPFGHGMSYAEFEYANLEVAPGDDGEWSARVTVTNVGSVDGRDVVQFYVAPPPRQDQPPQELAGFRSVKLKAGESQTISVPLDIHAFFQWMPQSKRWERPPGRYEIRASHSSRVHGDAVSVQLPFAEKLSKSSATREPKVAPGATPPSM